MTRNEELNLLRYARQLHGFNVRGPKLLLGLGLGLVGFLVGIPVTLSLLAGLVHLFLQ